MGLEITKPAETLDVSQLSLEELQKLFTRSEIRRDVGETVPQGGLLTLLGVVVPERWTEADFMDVYAFLQTKGVKDAGTLFDMPLRAVDGKQIDIIVTAKAAYVDAPPAMPAYEPIETTEIE